MKNIICRSGQGLSTGVLKPITGLVILIWQKMIINCLWDCRVPHFCQNMCLWSIISGIVSLIWKIIQTLWPVLNLSNREMQMLSRKWCPMQKTELPIAILLQLIMVQRLIIMTRLFHMVIRMPTMQCFRRDFPWDLKMIPKGKLMCLRLWCKNFHLQL